ncbi:MAG: 4Fe-4S dicluster domain-containing protein [Spirochaetaceae bacterium]|nr:MAG: 4Fe-4S dicluster domain-containing protein [Spirochaetaceae bacterium]
MASTRKRTIGGYRFARFTGQPHTGIVEIGLPQLVTIHLQAVDTAPGRLLVEKGETVAAGQIIARDDESVGNPVLATVNGTVEEIRKQPNPAVKIRSDGTDSWKPVEDYAAEWKKLKPAMLEKLVYLSGASGCVAGGIPTRFNSAAIAPKEVEHILLQMVPAEVFNPSVSAILAGRELTQVAEGLAILAKIMPKAGLHLVGGKRQKTLLQQVQTACIQYELERVHLHTVDNKYPNNRAEILIPTVLGREYAHGFSALNQGVLVIDLQALLLVRDAVATGKPAIERIVALAGQGFSERPHVRVRIGTPLEQVMDKYLDRRGPQRIVRNSLLTGEMLDDAAVDPLLATVIAVPEELQGPPMPFSRPGFRTDSYSRTFVASFVPFTKTIDTNIHGEHRPCIACTFCDSVCPAGILPHLLHRYVQRGLIDEVLVRYRIFDCIDCNLCTYVCTSKIPLAQLLREGKEKLKAEGLDPRLEEARSKGLKGIPGTAGGAEPGVRAAGVRAAGVRAAGVRGTGE